MATYSGQYGQWQLPGRPDTAYSGLWKPGYVPYQQTPYQEAKANQFKVVNTTNTVVMRTPEEQAERIRVAQEEARKAEEEAKKASSVFGLAKETVKGVVQRMIEPTKTFIKEREEETKKYYKEALQAGKTEDEAMREAERRRAAETALMFDTAILSLEKTLVNSLTKAVKAATKTSAKISAVKQILKKANVADDIISTYASKIAKATKESEVEAALKSIKEVQGTTFLKGLEKDIQTQIGEKMVYGERTPYLSVLRKPLEELPKPEKGVFLRISERAPKVIEESAILKQRLKAEASAAETAVKSYRAEIREAEKLEKQIAEEIAKPKRQQKNTISFVKKIGEFNQTVVNEIKKELNIDKPINKMEIVELQDIATKLKERLKFKYQMGYRPSPETAAKLGLRTELKPMLTESDYDKAADVYLKGESLKPKVKKALKGLSAGKTITPISTRLENISPTLKYSLRKYESDVLKTINESNKAVKPYLDKIKTGLFKKMSKIDFAKLDIALKNGDANKIKEINSKYGIEKEYKLVQETLDDLYRRAKEVGYEIGYEKNYWPRVIKDIEGFLAYFDKQEYRGIIDEAVKRKEMALGRLLEIEEKAQLINSMIRGFKSGHIFLSEIGAMKSRVIDTIPPELNKFYYDTPSSLIRYIDNVSEAIAARKFFGKGLKGVKPSESINIADSIGAYTADLLAKGKLTPKQEIELRDILTARFNGSEMHGIWPTIKNLIYINIMGTFQNAVTQIGDIAFSYYNAGFLKATKALAKSVVGASRITKEDIGLEARSIAQEFSDSGRVGKAVSNLFSSTGLNRIDRLGKETLINSAIDKYASLAKKNDANFIKKMDVIFGNETTQTLQDLRIGRISENVKYLAFNELLDFQPVALSEMPEAYLKAGNGRIFYMLKSYTLKMFDVYRREAFRLMADKNKKTKLSGFSNMIRLTAFLTIANATADEIKDTLLGRETSLKDRTIDQIATLLGFSRYTLGRMSEVGFGTALKEQVVPPTNFLDNLSKDLAALYKDFDESADINELRTVQDIPLIGKYYYWWFGKGKKSTEPKKVFEIGGGRSRRSSTKRKPLQLKKK